MTSLFVLNRVKKKIQEEKQQRELCACQESEIRLMHSPENQYEPLPTDLQCILELIIHFLLLKKNKYTLWENEPFICINNRSPKKQ